MASVWLFISFAAGSPTARAAVKWTAQCGTSAHEAWLPIAGEDSSNAQVCAANTDLLTGAVSVPLATDMDHVHERLCTPSLWPNLFWYVDDVRVTSQADIINAQVQIHAAGRKAWVHLEVDCSTPSPSFTVARADSRWVARAHWVEVHGAGATHLEGRLQVVQGRSLPSQLEQLVLQRLLVGPTLALAAAHHASQPGGPVDLPPSPRSKEYTIHELL